MRWFVSTPGVDEGRSPRESGSGRARGPVRCPNRRSRTRERLGGDELLGECKVGFERGLAERSECVILVGSIHTMSTPKIVAYLKPTCGWSNGVRAILKKYELAYEDRNIIEDPAQRHEMEKKSGQSLSPCVEVNGTMLADVSGDEVEAYLLANQLVLPTDREAEAPTHQCCGANR